jgi:hypothetical protein
MSWCGVLWVYKANERRKRQREADRSTCRKLHLSPTKIPQYIQSDHLFVPSGRSKCISHKQDREVNAGVPPKHVSAILGASHILKRTKWQMIVLVHVPKLFFPLQENLTASVGQWHRLMRQSYSLRAHIEVSGKSRRRKKEKRKRKEKKKSKSYGYCCLSYQIACH